MSHASQCFSMTLENRLHPVSSKVIGRNPLNSSGMLSFGNSRTSIQFQRYLSGAVGLRTLSLTPAGPRCSPASCRLLPRALLVSSPPFVLLVPVVLPVSSSSPVLRSVLPVAGVVVPLWCVRSGCSVSVCVCRSDGCMFWVCAVLLTGLRLVYVAMQRCKRSMVVVVVTNPGLGRRPQADSRWRRSITTSGAALGKSPGSSSPVQ